MQSPLHCTLWRLRKFPSKRGRTPVECKKCNRVFTSKQCFDRHRTGLICEKVKQCRTCFKVVDSRRRKSHHICGAHVRKLCDTIISPDHPCFIKRTSKRIDKYLYDFEVCAYDFESEILDTDNFTVKEHQVNLCVAMQRWYNCLTDEKSETCRTCGTSTHIFSTLSDFVEYVLLPRNEFIKKFPAQHCSRFDNLFVLRHHMTVHKIRFPYLLNTDSFQNYVGPMPGIEYYDPDQMSDMNRAKLLKWHAKCVAESRDFNLKEKLVLYCTSDMNILISTVVKYTQLIEHISEIQPFIACSTIAYIATKIYQTKLM